MSHSKDARPVSSSQTAGVGQFICDYPWQETPVGELSDWGPELTVSLRNILSSTQPLMIVWGPQQFVFHNDAMSEFRRRLGVTPICVGVPSSQCWEDFCPAVQEEIEEVYQKSRSGPTRLFAISKRDSVPDLCYVEGSCTAIFNAEDRLVGLQLHFHVPSDASANRHGLDRGSAKYVMLEDVPFDIMVFNRTRNLVYINKAAREGLGMIGAGPLDYSAVMKLANSGGTLLSEQGRKLEPGDSILEAALQSGTTHSIVYQRILSDGVSRTWKSSFAVPIFDNLRSVEEVLIVNQTISDQKNAERLARVSRNQFHTILNTIPSSICIYDQKGVMTFANVAARNMFADLGLDRDALPSLQDYEASVSAHFYSLDDDGKTRTEFALRVNQAIGGAAQVGLLKRKSSHDVLPQWIEERALPMSGDGDTTGEVICVLTDISGHADLSERLQKSEQQFRIMADAAPNMIWALNPDGTVRYINEYGKQFLGIADVGMNSISPAAFLHPDEADQVLQTLAESMSSFTPFSMEQLVRRHDGSYRTLLVNAAPSFYPDGQLFGYVGSSIDITDSREATSALAKSEELFRVFSNNLQNLAWIADAEGWIFWYNQRWYDYTGTTLDEMQGWGWEKVHHPDHIARVKGLVQQYWLRDEPFELIFPLRSQEGEYRWFLTRAVPVLDSDGKRYLWIGTNTDIHDQIVAEQALQESETRFRSLAETLPQMVWVTNADGTVQEFISKRWQDYFGPVTSSYAWTNMTIPHEREAANAAFANAIATGEPFTSEVRLKNKEGHFRWHRTAGVPVRNDDGVVINWVGSIFDVHDEKSIAERLEKEVAVRTQELRRSNEDLQQFAHVASHDLKEPVRKILTFSRMLKTAEDSAMGQTGHFYLRKVEHAAERMMDMVSGILAYSGIASTREEMTSVDLGQTIQLCIGDLEVLVLEKSAKIEVGQLPQIAGIPILIQQLFTNLINNSLKFSRAGIPPEITIEAVRQDGPWALIEVSDNGIGFEPQYAEQIFRTFTRLHAKDVYEGTGLGLSLCRRIVERHGGTISAQSSGTGSTFSIRLPLWKDDH